MHIRGYLAVFFIWSGIHTSVTGSVSSVMFTQTDLDMVTPLQTVHGQQVQSEQSSVSSFSLGRPHTLQSTSVRFSQLVFSQVQ